jgi:hypothetical protein
VGAAALPWLNFLWSLDAALLELDGRDLPAARRAELREAATGL